MAGEKLNYVYSAYAGANHVGKEGRFVTITGAKDGLPVVTVTTAGTKADGVILRGDEQGTVERIGKDGILWVVADDAIPSIGEVEVGNEGGCKPKDSGIAVGKALATATKGDMIPVFVY